MTIVRANSLLEAVEHAEALKAAGAYDLFRGQTRDWRPLRTSLARQSADERQRTFERLSRLEAWASTAPEMTESSKDPDQLFAIAQHYGIATNYMDFSTEPRIAGFFATDGLARDQSDDTPSCIICVNSRELSEFSKSVHAVRRDWPEAQVIQVQVPELWRLHAQRGCFIFLPYDDFERLYHFDRICFPPHRGESPVPREDVYPRQKSDLEIALDRFFMQETMRSNAPIIAGMPWHELPMDAPPDGLEAECFVPDGLPRHRSWEPGRLASWEKPAAEAWTEYSKAPLWRVDPPADGHPPDRVSALADVLCQRFESEPDLRRGPVMWRCEGFPDVENSLGLFWDGTRRWPYGVRDLARGLALTAVFGAAVAQSEQTVAFSHVADALVKKCLGAECIEVEIAMSDGSYTRGHARRDELENAVRDDFAMYLADGWRPKIRGISNVMQIASVPDHVFDFEALSRVFVREVVPTQVVLRGERSGKGRMYNVARATRFGLV